MKVAAEGKGGGGGSIIVAENGSLILGLGGKAWKTYFEAAVRPRGRSTVGRAGESIRWHLHSRSGA